MNREWGRQKTFGWCNYYQRVLLSGTKVKCCLVQHLHKVLQTWHIDFIFHCLRMSKLLLQISKCQNYIHNFSIECKAEQDVEEILTAATGIRISTKRPARACFISLSLTSKKYWAHSYEKTPKVQLILVSSIQPILTRICSLILAASFFSC